MTLICAHCHKSGRMAYHIPGVGWFHRRCYFENRRTIVGSER